MKRALVIVDVQTDFLPGGRLAVPRGDEVIPVVNNELSQYEIVVATQDWHPADHLSFASQHPGRGPGEWIELNGLAQILWPDHCVQGSSGAALAEGLNPGPIRAIFRKGMDRGVDSYSGFFDNGHRNPTGLDGYLRGVGVTRVAVLGLALDYCVKATALDAKALGFETEVIAHATRAVNVAPADGERALEALRAAGIEIR